jgi:hypothetical protein
MMGRWKAIIEIESVMLVVADISIVVNYRVMGETLSLDVAKLIPPIEARHP